MRMAFTAVLAFLLLGVSAWASDNFLELRSEYVIPRDDSSERYVATDNYYSHRTGEWDIALEFITGDNGFHDTWGYLTHEVIDGIYLGGRGAVDNSGRFRPAFYMMLSKELRVPAIKAPLSFSGTFTQEFSVSDSLTDTWARISGTHDKILLGAEIGYYFYGNGPGNLYLRPLRLGYFLTEDVMAFIMPQWSYVNGEIVSRSILFGVDIKW